MAKLLRLRMRRIELVDGKSLLISSLVPRRAAMCGDHEAAVHECQILAFRRRRHGAETEAVVKMDDVGLDIRQP